MRGPDDPRFRETLRTSLFPLVACCLVLLGLNHLVERAPGAGAGAAALGFLAVAATLAGRFAKAVGLPRLTGYLILGALAGPHVGGLLPEELLAGTRMIEGMAVALIALLAGSEIRLDWLRANGKRVMTIAGFELLVVTAGVLGGVLLLRHMLPFVPNDFVTAGVVALVLGAIAVANSPTVTIAVVDETKADGPVARTVLGVTVVKDVAVVILFAVTLAFARSWFGKSASESPLALTLAWELGGSILVGVAVGAVLAMILRRRPGDLAILTLALTVVLAQMATLLHLEVLLVALTAGFWVRSLDPLLMGVREEDEHSPGSAMAHGLERISRPLFALFFAATGTHLDPDVLKVLWLPALALVGIRAVCVWVGTRIGCAVAKTEPMVKRYAWTGFVSQAGVTLALATVVARAFPAWGPGAQALIVAVVAIHELIGPVAFQWGLRRAGEAGQADSADEVVEGGHALPSPP